jgi:hypothetical protein
MKPYMVSGAPAYCPANLLMKAKFPKLPLPSSAPTEMHKLPIP